MDRESAEIRYKKIIEKKNYESLYDVRCANENSCTTIATDDSPLFEGTKNVEAGIVDVATHLKNKLQRTSNSCVFCAPFHAFETSFTQASSRPISHHPLFAIQCEMYKIYNAYASNQSVKHKSQVRVSPVYRLNKHKGIRASEIQQILNFRWWMSHYRR